MFSRILDMITVLCIVIFKLTTEGLMLCVPLSIVYFEGLFGSYKIFVSHFILVSEKLSLVRNRYT